MNYSETLDYLVSRLPMFQRVGAAAYKANLNNTLYICDILGNPEKKIKTIHIAGTNGKGSVSHLIASILQEQGYKTGLYTSPHLTDFRERIRINGEKIPEKNVIEFVENHKEKFESIQPSFFEYTFGMALHYFEEEKTDIAIMETGMGGRLDSTNVITPMVSVITNIGFDHTQFLGDTLKKIAVEKAGIIKENIPVIIGESQEELKHVFVNSAILKNAAITFADQIFLLKNIVYASTFDELILDLYKINKIVYAQLSCPLTGVYQQKNIVTAIALAEELIRQGFYISKNNIYNGVKNVVKNTRLQGRWQFLGKNPLIICDTGHNMDGIAHVVSQISKLNFDNLHFVLGMVADKSIGQILTLLPKNAEYYFCKANIPRGLDPNELLKKAGEFNLVGDSYHSVKEAFERAKRNATENDLVFVGGSTFVVAEVL
jgi:dihydrofolate synthase/folylpolyglutamate synthase